MAPALRRVTLAAGKSSARSPERTPVPGTLDAVATHARQAPSLSAAANALRPG